MEEFIKYLDAVEFDANFDRVVQIENTREMISEYLELKK